MMALYPTPNVTSIYDVMNYTNNNMIYDVQGAAVGGYFGTLLLFAIFVIVFVSQKDRQPTENAFALSGFITFVLSVVFMPLNLAPVWAVGMFFGLMIIGVILVWKND